MAQAPTFSAVSRSRRPPLPLGRRPLLHDRAAGQSDADPHGGDDARAVVAELDDRDEGHRRRAAVPPRPARRRRRRRSPSDSGSRRELLREPVAGQLVHSEGGVQLPDDVVGRQVAVLELVDVGHHLGLDEPPDGVADHQLLFGPFEHRAPPWRPWLADSGVGPLAMRLSEARLQSECEEQAPVRIGRKKEGTPYERWGGEAVLHRPGRPVLRRGRRRSAARPHVPRRPDRGRRPTWRSSSCSSGADPTTYSEQRGHPRLRMRHARFAIGTAEADAWLRHMTDGGAGERDGAGRRGGAPRLPHDGRPEPGQHTGLRVAPARVVRGPAGGRRAWSDRSLRLVFLTLRGCPIAHPAHYPVRRGECPGPVSSAPAGGPIRE